MAGGDILASMFGNLKAYYTLVKPGIIRGNLLTAAAGYLFAGHFHVTTFIAMLAGLGMIIACGCVLNNYIDRDIDKLMERTKKRALVSGTISTTSAMVFAAALGIFGTLVLVYGTNLSTAYLALFGLFAYVVLYGVAKRKTVYGTLVGSISGAIPPVVGYAAAANSLSDAAGFMLFALLVVWQMPHFYAIAMYRAKDYAKAQIPVLPLVKGMQATKIQILTYIAGFISVSALFTFWGHTGYIFLAVMLLLGTWWLRVGLTNLRILDDEKWGKKMFLTSLVVILVTSIMLPLGALLP